MLMHVTIGPNHIKTPKTIDIHSIHTFDYLRQITDSLRITDLNGKDELYEKIKYVDNIVSLLYSIAVLFLEHSIL